MCKIGQTCKHLPASVVSWVDILQPKCNGILGSALVGVIGELAAKQAGLQPKIT